MSAIASDHEENKPGRKCLLGNWVEEGATALLDSTRPRTCIHKHGHTGILTTDVAAKVQGTSTFRAAFNASTSLGMRQRGRRTELLENDLIKRIRDEIHADLNADPPIAELSSVTKADYKVEGFKSVRACPNSTMGHEYTTEQAITFWSDNYQKIQGMTAVKRKDSPFKRSAAFSTPIGEQLDQLDDTVLYPSEKDAHL
ncbi:sperm associated antigen 8 [Danio aesculapii]|uniref:sperm associated antigen 8 n=1 Tax=Danio aesculapii TaxID=1142201 RepID=UPI0024BFA284|nr:sperm associated antigen 8 [Danio aesculapii]